MKNLVVNADDYGRTADVSRGIREAHWKGIVTSTTAMMNMPSAAADLQTALEETPALGLGVHLTLTAAAPVLPASQVRSLVNGDGEFLTLAQFQARAEWINLRELAAEWRAQIELFCEVVGRAPDHLDSHHHTSYVSPDIFATMLALAQEYHVPIRVPFDVEENDPKIIAMRDSTRQLLETRPVPHPMYFVSSFYAQGATKKHLVEVIETLNEGVTELMCHPGYADAELLSESSYATEREREVEALTDAQVKEAIRKGGVTLVSFAQLKSS